MQHNGVYFFQDIDHALTWAHENFRHINVALWQINLNGMQWLPDKIVGRAGAIRRLVPPSALTLLETFPSDSLNGQTIAAFMDGWNGKPIGSWRNKDTETLRRLRH